MYIHIYTYIHRYTHTHTNTYIYILHQLECQECMSHVTLMPRLERLAGNHHSILNTQYPVSQRERPNSARHPCCSCCTTHRSNQRYLSNATSTYVSDARVRRGLTRLECPRGRCLSFVLSLPPPAISRKATSNKNDTAEWRHRTWMQSACAPAALYRK